MLWLQLQPGVVMTCQAEQQCLCHSHHLLPAGRRQPLHEQLPRCCELMTNWATHQGSTDLGLLQRLLQVTPPCSSQRTAHELSGWQEVLHACQLEKSRMPTTAVQESSLAVAHSTGLAAKIQHGAGRQNL